ncbi:hypothetical protein IU471_03960 [Nocardia elegans]|uniref:hypothetical protein n=1 Tax=Nocardia elegans TaxID=300029 RepID=UPI001894B9CF|nr:hypothetical protein [Nocardia elegans]MBF6242737.1 hypothetical protein [Nocardia elegans]
MKRNRRPAALVPDAGYEEDVIDLQAHRRCRLERRGLDPVSIAVHLLAETGSAPAGWDFDPDGGEDWAA